MAQVISATTAFGRNSLSGKRTRFLLQAHDLLLRARSRAAAGDFEQAVEYAYQAALRTAGAWVADSSVGRRKRLPASAWDRLSLVGGAAGEWVELFRPYSRLRSRLISGLEDSVSADNAMALISSVADFLYAAEGTELVAAAA
ncbi:hypothetical protein CPHO_04185 [Corynebacterium phocae]|uniref:SAV-6107-like HEPN domain-containing protein n=1 Tax=Corynebacterium phocae TaxID=161895 RepID=A0A1L7D262_9CORY|nr:SAV_6107 family HEPN domain-containing protein [Corynebacterium phocae]APT92219.1 hypothetical protein CPHO_04185 [Corynebacterium phocae]KAA8725798.1 hypothetical protein F4V58_03735 [Corynebacterium phocae]